MYKCGNCGCTFEEESIKEERILTGEYWGAPAYETVYCCPCCGVDDVYNIDEEDEKDE